jgi:hypothetical protein
MALANSFNQRPEILNQLIWLPFVTDVLPKSLPIMLNR